MMASPQEIVCFAPPSNHVRELLSVVEKSPRLDNIFSIPEVSAVLGTSLRTASDDGHRRDWRLVGHSGLFTWHKSSNLHADLGKSFGLFKTF